MLESAPRLARLQNVNLISGTCDVKWLDTTGGSREGCVFSQPYMGRGWGIYAGVEDGSLVWAQEELGGHIRISNYYPLPLFLSDEFDSHPTVSPDEFRYREIQSGEVILQSKPNSIIFLDDAGNIELSTPDGNSIEILREEDTIREIAANKETIVEAGSIISGVVKRDTRTKEEKEEDILFGTLFNTDIPLAKITDYIGINPEHKVSTAGGTELIGLIDTREGESGSFNNITTLANPALTELKIDVREFADSNPGLDIDTLSDNEKILGKLPQNTLARLTIGTTVNEIGKQIRMDYGFGENVDNVKGHENVLWRMPGLNNNAGTTNHLKFDPENTLQAPQEIENRIDQEWTINKISKVNLATMVDFTLHTKGASNAGNQEDETYRGSYWSLQIDKEGLTKVNIPAATIADGEEPYREGRSLLMNLDGSWDLSVGRQKCTDEKGLDSICGTGTNPSQFITRNRRDNIDALTGKGYGRKDRSLTADFEGNVELLIGRDANTGQSLMIEGDGSLAFYFGKEIESADGSQDNFTSITQASLAPDRIDRSITGKTEGNVELLLGMDAAQKQSLALELAGGTVIKAGEDANNDSLIIETVGRQHYKTQTGNEINILEKEDSINIMHSGGNFATFEKEKITIKHKTGALFQIDDKGNIIIQNAVGHGLVIDEKGVKLMTSGGAFADLKDDVFAMGSAAGDSIEYFKEGGINLTASKTLTLTAEMIFLNSTNIDIGAGAATSGAFVQSTISNPFDILTQIPHNGHGNVRIG